MSVNSFTGFLPITLCSLKNLEYLSLYTNNLMIDAYTPQAASILSCLLNLRNLTELLLADNPLNTTIPASRGNISTTLLTVDLSISNIRGNIPVDIANLSSLITLDIGNNQLSGAIPTLIQRLQNLQALYFNDNVLRGQIPYGLCQLNNLAELDLGGNRLSGSIPSCLAKFLNFSFFRHQIPFEKSRLVKYRFFIGTTRKYARALLREHVVSGVIG
nr:probable leucine-rich repeat receptor-like protein kinase At2g33170 [Malus domestica]